MLELVTQGLEMKLNKLVYLLCFVTFNSLADYPKCALGICFDKKLNGVKYVSKIFNSSKVLNGCNVVRVSGDRKNVLAYLSWNKENSNPYLETLTIAQFPVLNRTENCENTNLIPVTDGGVGIGSTVDRLIKIHGHPTRIDDSSSEAKSSLESRSVINVNGQKIRINSDSVYVYTKNPDSDLLTTYFFIKNKQVACISISISE